MNDSFSLNGVFVNRNFQISAQLCIRDNLYGTAKFCSTIIYNWARHKFQTLELDQNIRSGSKKRYDQKIDIIYNIEEPYFCLNAEHADRSVAGRVWSIEAEIIKIKEKLLFGTRVSYTTPSDFDLPTPSFSVPRFVTDISKRNGLLDIIRIDPHVKRINSREDVDELYDFLINPSRRLPIVLVAEKSEMIVDGSQHNDIFPINTDKLARRIGMIAHVFAISKECISEWNSIIAYNFRILEGAVRTYNTNFDDSVDQILKHPFSTIKKIFASNYYDDEGNELTGGDAYEVILAQRIIYDSLRNRIDWKGIGHKFYFAANREKLRLKEQGTLDRKEQVLLYEEQICELEEKIENQENEILTAWQETEDYKKQLEEEKRTVFSLSTRIDFLRKQLFEKGELEEIPIPNNYDEMTEWVEKYYPGKIILHSRAKRNIKEAVFEDITLVYKCLKLLAEDYVMMRKGDLSRQDFEEKCAQLGVEESGAIADNRAGELGDTYFVDYHNRKEKLDRHITKGATRDPKLCMRIYFFWDDEEEKVVIGSLPQHLQIRTS